MFFQDYSRYLVEKESCWVRIRVDDDFNEGGSNGDEEWVDLRYIFKVKPVTC